MKKIVVIAEYIDDKIRPITDELVACALKISAITEAEVMVLNIEGINHLESEIYKSNLAQILKNIKPDFIIMGHTSQGIDVAPGLALRLGVAAVTGINKVSCIPAADGQINNGILFSRSVFKGKLNALICLENPDTPTLVTVQPGSFSIETGTTSERDWLSATTKNESLHGYNSLIRISYKARAAEDGVHNKEESVSHVKIDSHTLDLTANIASPYPLYSFDPVETLYPIEYSKPLQSAATKSKLNQAKTIIAAGRGIGEQENIVHIEKLSACFTNSAVAGSRPLIDMGWMPYEQQVGITGTVVSPELYMAVGISGSSQHVAGMKDSKFIVSVNKDPNAAIFNISDLSIVEDSLHFIETFIKISEE